MTQDAQLNIILKTARSKNTEELLIRCEYIHIVVESFELTIKCTAGVRRELCDQCIAAHKGKPPWWTKTVIGTVTGITLHNAVRFEIFVQQFLNTYPRAQSRHVSLTFEKATESYMVEIITESHF